MNRKEIITEFKTRYLKNDPITEKDIVISDPEYFRTVLEEFGSWHKLEKEVGILKRHIKEREKYFLFLMMKERKERFGVEALRHKNIEEEIKEKISDNFGTVKNLTKNILDGWNQDRVLFEAHTFFITGGTASSLKKYRSILFEKIPQFFVTEERFYKEYEKRFLIQPLNEDIVEQVEPEEEVEEVKSVPTGSVGFNIETLVAIGYMKQEDVEELRAAASKSKEEILEFVSGLDSNITDQELAKENRLMWLAIKNQLGGIDAARQELIANAKQA